MRLVCSQQEDAAAAYTSRPKEELQSIALKDALNVWQDKHGRATGAPPAADFDILDYLQVMRNISLIEVREAPLDFVYRVHSLAWAENVGMDLTGRSLWEHPDPHYRSFVWEACKRAKEVREVQIVIEDVLVRRALMSEERPFLWEAIFLPFEGDRGGVTRLAVIFDLLPPR